MPGDFHLAWNYSGILWNVTGTPDHSYDACLKHTREFVLDSNIDRPLELADRDIYAFSYFFDRGFQAELVDGEQGGATTVGAFRAAAVEGLLA